MVILVVMNPPVNAGDVRDMGLIPGSGRSPGGGHGNLFQYSCQGNSMDKGAWRAIVHGVTKSWTRLKYLSTHALQVKLSETVCRTETSSQSSETNL